jgi:hypothetical protein
MISITALLIVICAPIPPPPIMCQVYPGRSLSTDLRLYPKQRKSRAPTWGPRS